MNRNLLLKSLATAGLVLCSGVGHAQSFDRIGAASAASPRAASPRGMLWYVDASAPGGPDGLSWAGAFNDLQQALVRARSRDRIWVAAGTYVPTSVGGPQSATFLVPSGVSVYGGFDGTEGSISERDPVTNVTVLSGDINGDDVTFPTLNIGTPNSWNVVTFRDAARGTRVDGFRVEAGHIYQAPAALRNGAGMHMENSSPTVVDCSFSYCLAEKGGAIHSDVGSPTITGCSFSNNVAFYSSASGGAINTEGGTLTVLDSLFTGNEAVGNLGKGVGGAISSSNGSTWVEGCTFTDNSALPRFGNSYTVSLGGAIFVGSGSVQVLASSFFGNQSNVGGAISTSILTGAPACQVLNSVFSGNFVVTALTSGGWDIGGDVGGIHGSPIATVDVIGCTVYGGSADNSGGVRIEGLGTVSSSVFWNNSDNKGTIGASQVKADRVEYSCVMNMLIGEPGEDPPDPRKFPGSIALDPGFVNAGQGDYRLQAGSPCIDAGQNPAWPAFVSTDRDGGARFVDDASVLDTGVGPGPIVDMGPYERR